MDGCFYCENGEKLHSLMVEVCQLEYAKVYLNRDQKHPGRCIVQLKDHKNEFFELSGEERNGFFKELALVAKAIFQVYHPDKINYATYGDLVPHVHVHIVPKYEGGLNWGGPFDDTLARVTLEEEEYQAACQKLKHAIEELKVNGFI